MSDENASGNQDGSQQPDRNAGIWPAVLVILTIIILLTFMFPPGR